MRNAIIAAVVSALVSAASGVAAARYIITSTSQIKPSVLRKLEKTSAPASAPTPVVVQGIPGAKGDAGPQGEAGPRGYAGESGSFVADVTQHASEPRTLDAGTWRSEGIEARCPSESEEVMSGGYEASSPYVSVWASHRSPQGWTVSAYNGGEHEASVTAYVLCSG